MNVTLTKAELADLLFEQVGLNKREAKDMVEGFFEEIRTALDAWRQRETVPGSVTFSCVTNRSVRDATRRLARKFRSLPVGWSPSTPARSSRPR